MKVSPKVMKEVCFMLPVLYRRSMKSDFGTVPAKQKTIIRGFISRNKITETSQISLFVKSRFEDWMRWPNKSKDNLAGFIFKDADYQIWLKKRTQSNVGKISEDDYWEV